MRIEKGEMRDDKLKYFWIRSNLPDPQNLRSAIALLAQIRVIRGQKLTTEGTDEEHGKEW